MRERVSVSPNPRLGVSVMKALKNPGIRLRSQTTKLKGERLCFLPWKKRTILRNSEGKKVGEA